MDHVKDTSGESLPVKEHRLYTVSWAKSKEEQKKELEEKKSSRRNEILSILFEGLLLVLATLLLCLALKVAYQEGAEFNKAKAVAVQSVVSSSVEEHRNIQNLSDLIVQSFSSTK